MMMTPKEGMIRYWGICNFSTSFACIQGVCINNNRKVRWFWRNFDIELQQSFLKEVSLIKDCAQWRRERYRISGSCFKCQQPITWDVNQTFWGLALPVAWQHFMHNSIDAPHSTVIMKSVTGFLGILSPWWHLCKGKVKAALQIIIVLSLWKEKYIQTKGFYKAKRRPHTKKRQKTRTGKAIKFSVWMCVSH